MSHSYYEVQYEFSMTIEGAVADMAQIAARIAQILEKHVTADRSHPPDFELVAPVIRFTFYGWKDDMGKILGEVEEIVREVEQNPDYTIGPLSLKTIGRAWYVDVYGDRTRD